MEYSEELKRTAYLKGLELKKTSLDAEAIYARLEKQGIPPALAAEVANNVIEQRGIDEVNSVLPPWYGTLLYMIRKRFK